MPFLSNLKLLSANSFSLESKNVVWEMVKMYSVYYLYSFRSVLGKIHFHIQVLFTIYDKNVSLPGLKVL